MTDLDNEFFVDSRDYLYQPFSHEGFSGQLLLATPVEEGLAPLIVKQEQPCSACCEFVYSRLAKEMQIPVPQAFLVKKSARKWQRSIKKYCENTNLCQVNGKYETSM